MALQGEAASTHVEVYINTFCDELLVECRKVTKLLDQLSVPYVTIDVDAKDTQPSPSSPTAFTRWVRLAHARRDTVPQVYVGYPSDVVSPVDIADSTRVGGLENLANEVADGTFQRRLDDVISAAAVMSDLPVVSMIGVDRMASVPSSLPGEDQPDAVAYLNTPPTPTNRPGAALALVQALQRRALALTDAFATADGARIDYNTMRPSEPFAQYMAVVAELRDTSLVTLAALPAPARLACFVNLYNAMVLHATCILGPPEDSPDARAAFFSGRTGAVYTIGGHLFSLDDVEHGIIRANQPHPSQVSADPHAASFLPPWDSRAALALPYLDPRVHFVLNGGAASSPPIKIVPEDPEPALQAAAAAFLSREIRLRQPDTALPPVQSATYDTLVGLAAAENTTVTFPRLLLWYAADFGPSLSQRVTWMRGMLEAGDEAASTWATHGDVEVCKVGDKRYAHAVLTGLLRSYAQAAPAAEAILATRLAEVADQEEETQMWERYYTENMREAEMANNTHMEQVHERDAEMNSMENLQLAVVMARCRRVATPAAALATAVAAVDARVRYNAYNWGSNAL